MSAVMETHGLSAGYAGAPVIHDVEITVNPGEVACMLGRE